MINFALVKFMDLTSKEIRPITDVRNFDPMDENDFEKAKQYNVLWPSVAEAKEKGQMRVYYPALIQCLAEKAEHIDIKKRYSVAPARSLTSASDLEPEATSISQAITHKDKVERLHSIKKRKIESLKSIGHASSMRNQENYHTDSDCQSASSSESSSDDDDDVVPKKFLSKAKKEINALKIKNKKLKTKLKSQQNELQEYKARLNSRDNNLKIEIEQMHEQMHQMNENVDRKFDQLHQMMSKHLETPVNTAESQNFGNGSKEEFQMFGDVKVSKRLLKMRLTKAKDTIFVKDLAQIIWGKDILRERSISGRPSPLFPNAPARPPLTPEKFEALKDAFRQRLRDRDYAESTIEEYVRLVPRWMSEKISDLRKNGNGRCVVDHTIAAESVEVAPMTPPPSRSSS